MIGIVIIISVIFVAYFTFILTKTKIAKYLLPPIISILYGFMLFFIGMSMSGILFLVLAVLPVVFVVLRIIMLKNAK